MEGVSFAKYQRRFGSSLGIDLPQLNEMSELGLLAEDTNFLRLNEAGLAYSDTIGPWLYSDLVTSTMDACELT